MKVRWCIDGLRALRYRNKTCHEERDTYYCCLFKENFSAIGRFKGGGGEAMTWQHEVVILEKNVRDLQESLTIAHKKIAELAGIVRNKNVSLKAINEIVSKEIVSL